MAEEEVPVEIVNSPEPEISKIVEEKVAENLKEIKAKLDNAYNARDEALKRIAEFEKREKEAELARLKEEGKHKEAYELQLAEERARREMLEKRNIELTRDIEIRNTLSSHPFRNDNAREMAYREIVGQVVQDENGIWRHRSGAMITEFVDTFVNNEENSFLLKTKINSGTGSKPSIPNAPVNEKRSLFAMTQEEVLKLAREGKLPS